MAFTNSCIYSRMFVLQPFVLICYVYIFSHACSTAMGIDQIRSGDSLECCDANIVHAFFWFVYITYVLHKI